MNETVINLAEAKDLKSVGGKALALGILLRAGFSVPDGFVITPTGVSSEDEVLKAFDNLSSQYVAVRSSGVAEDSGDAAWAGQFETFVNVARDNLLEKIKQCQLSGHSQRAQSYAQQKGLTTGTVAVIVQQMIQGDKSGIAFSVNPVTKNADEIVIEAGLGLNEAVVSGEITPDTYTVSKSSGNILQKHIGNQTKKLILGENGNQWEVVANGTQQKLEDGEIQEVASLAQKLESHFGFPVDIEWTFEGGGLYILQSRPITTL
jgi:phosphoenolpyruvate synthase/pyruvate phosphate dikinase